MTSRAKELYDLVCAWPVLLVSRFGSDRVSQATKTADLGSFYLIFWTQNLEIGALARLTCRECAPALSPHSRSNVLLLCLVAATCENHFLQIQDSLSSTYVKRYRVRVGRGTSYVCIDRDSNMFGGLIGQAGKVYVPAMARAVLCSAQPCCLYLS